MAGIVKESFPRVPVVLDPVAQMRRLTSELRAGAGIEQGGFLSLTTALGQLGDADSVQSIEYRDGRLSVRFLPRIAESESQRKLLAERAAKLGMDLRFAGEKAILSPKALQ
jgi:hypothetical protein